jgi:transposase-like protein
MALKDYLDKCGVKLVDDSVLREGLQWLVQAFMELEVEQRIGAGKYERTAERTTQRNGYRDRPWQTRVGDLTLRVPKLREGSYFPSLLEPRRRAEKALRAVVMQAYVTGTSTRKVDGLVEALGLSGMDKSAVSRICEELDEWVTPLRERPLEGGYPYIWLDALYPKVRLNHRIVNRAVVIAIGVRETGERELLGFDVGASEEAAFWTAFLRSLVRRGLHGVQLVISDAHEGLKAAIGQVFQGASWQRCRVHFMRNLLAHIPQGDKALVAAAVRTIFAQPNRQAAGQQLEEVAQTMQSRWAKAAELLRAAADDVLAYMAFPSEHWTRLYSTNLLERLNREVRRRTDVVGVFPDDDALLRLVGAVLLETADEWTLERRYFSQASMDKLLAPQTLDALAAREAGTPQPLRLAPVR